MTDLKPVKSATDRSGCECEECHVTMHASDCAVHNEPALPKGRCDCGATFHSRRCGIYNFAGHGGCTCGYKDKRR
jgi:hypothetical protein